MRKLNKIITTAAIISQVRRYTVTRYTYPGRQIIVAPSTRTPGG